MNVPVKAMRLGVMIAAACFASQQARAVSYSFERITDNGNGVDPASQFSVDVTDPGSSQVSFKFSNLGSIASIIGDIYWDDNGTAGTTPTPGAAARLLSFVTPFTGDPAADVKFAVGSGDLPSGNPVDFAAQFNASREASGGISNGIDNNTTSPGETLTVLFNLQGGKTFNDILAAMDSGELRVGLHVQSIGTKAGSDSFVSVGVPDGGATALLLGFGFLGLGCLRRRS